MIQMLHPSSKKHAKNHNKRDQTDRAQDKRENQEKIHPQTTHR